MIICDEHSLAVTKRDVWRLEGFARACAFCNECRSSSMQLIIDNITAVEYKVQRSEASTIHLVVQCLPPYSVKMLCYNIASLRCAGSGSCSLEAAPHQRLPSQCILALCPRFTGNYHAGCACLLVHHSILASDDYSTCVFDTQWISPTKFANSTAAAYLEIQTERQREAEQ